MQTHHTFIGFEKIPQGGIVVPQAVFTTKTGVFNRVRSDPVISFSRNRVPGVLLRDARPETVDDARTPIEITENTQSAGGDAKTVRIVIKVRTRSYRYSYRGPKAVSVAWLCTMGTASAAHKGGRKRHSGSESLPGGRRFSTGAFVRYLF